MLTDAAVRHAKPKDKPYKLSDKLGLYLLVNPSGGKLWRMNYRFGGKQKTLTFGAYPAVSLAEARENRNAARSRLQSGEDPAIERKVRKEEALRKAMESTEEAAPLRFDLTEAGALFIKANGARLRLSPSQVAALRAFLEASTPAPSEATPPC